MDISIEKQLWDRANIFIKIILFIGFFFVGLGMQMLGFTWGKAELTDAKDRR